MIDSASSVVESVKALSSSVQWQQGLQVVVPCLLHHLGLPCGFPFLQLCCDSAAEEFLQPYRVINAVAATTAFNLASYAKETPWWVATKGTNKNPGCISPTQIMNYINLLFVSRLNDQLSTRIGLAVFRSFVVAGFQVDLVYGLLEDFQVPNFVPQTEVTSPFLGFFGIISLSCGFFSLISWFLRFGSFFW